MRAADTSGFSIELDEIARKDALYHRRLKGFCNV
jgi:hypothetical protein